MQSDECISNLNEVQFGHVMKHYTLPRLAIALLSLFVFIIIIVIVIAIAFCGCHTVRNCGGFVVSLLLLIWDPNLLCCLE